MAAVIVGGRGKASQQIAEMVSLFTTDASSAPMLGFNRDMMTPFGTTNSVAGDRIRDAWWVTITIDSLGISGRSIWDRDN